jgi:protoheme IX farnesyltransferase
LSQAAHTSSQADVALEKGESVAALIVETTKPRITRLVTITSGVGFVMAAIARPWSASELLIAAIGCMVGTAASAAGANALNQWMERERDATMPRTQRRPLPRGSLTPAVVFWSGLALCVVGVLVLWLAAGVAPAVVSAATILSYLLIYTPLKPVSPLATLVGAVPGALPPLIGWTAASKPGFESLTEVGGWSLFAIMFVWQIPHFLAIAWMYKEDYAKGGYKVLPVIDPTGRATAWTILTWTVLLLPATLAPAWLMPGRLGWAYVAVATVTGLAYLVFAGRLSLNLTRSHARSTFIASVIHLPVLLVAMVAEALVRVIW